MSDGADDLCDLCLGSRQDRLDDLMTEMEVSLVEDQRPVTPVIGGIYLAQVCRPLRAVSFGVSSRSLSRHGPSDNSLPGGHSAPR